MDVRSLPLLALTLLGAAATHASQSPWSARLPETTGSVPQPIDRLQVVDCLLPGQVRRSGRMSYIGPRLPVRITAELCELRGGEYVLFDRAGVADAAAVWRERAEGGDVQAQLYLARIHERGYDGRGDLQQAVAWYRRAAEAGSNEARLALAGLYERGHGVERDPLLALNLYREAVGLAEDQLVFESSSQAELDALRQNLEAARSQGEARVAQLQEEVERLRQQRRRDQREHLRTMERALADARAAQASAARQIAALPEAPIRPTLRSVDGPDIPSPAALGATGFGRFHALVIGVQNYTRYEPLKTPIADARAIAEVLSARYGFRTITLLDADFASIVGGIVELSTAVGPEDNVLIYFAGHGVLVDEARGYWLPLDVEPSQRSPALPTETLAEFLELFKARSVLVIADSCFGSALSLSPGALTTGPLRYQPGLPQGYLQRKARYVLSSGGLAPVLDSGSEGHSVFAAALLDVLRDNREALTQTGLLAALRERVQAAAARVGFEQVPELRRIREAGDAGGAFFLVPGADAPPGAPTVGAVSDATLPMGMGD